MLLAQLLRPHIHSGRLTLVDWRGRFHEIGPENADSAGVVALKSARAHRRILLDPLVGIGDAYADGEIEILEGDLARIFALFLKDLKDRHTPWFVRWRRAFLPLARAFKERNGRDGSKRHIAHHYDLDRDFYRLWLDRELHYSCAFHDDPDASLESAQEEKARRIASKLYLRPGDRVLDIGCGWGAMALHLARNHDVHVTGISLSREQIEMARARAERAGLTRRITIEFKDYRDVEGPFDRIVSVGMLEHVGAPGLAEYFRTVERLLTADGVALIHTIGRTGPPGATNPWIRKRIFPGGSIPALSEIAKGLESSALICADIEVLRLHYAFTLKAWRDRFANRRGAVVARYGERFARMWEFYLAISEASFLAGMHVNYQVQLCRRLDALPLSRDYLAIDRGAPETAAAIHGARTAAE